MADKQEEEQHPHRSYRRSHGSARPGGTQRLILTIGGRVHAKGGGSGAHLRPHLIEERNVNNG